MHAFLSLVNITTCHYNQIYDHVCGATNSGNKPRVLCGLRAVFSICSRDYRQGGDNDRV